MIPSSQVPVRKSRSYRVFSTLFVLMLTIGLAGCGDTWRGVKKDTGENLKKTGEAIEDAGEEISN